LSIILYDFRHISISFQALRQSPFRWPILIVLILLILLIIGFAIFMARRWAKSRQTTEYTPGTLAGRTKA
jgi:predicted transporter